MNNLEQRFRKTLTDNAIRVTNPRLALFKALRLLNEPVPLSALISKVQGSDRASIYRNIELFEKLGICNVLLIGWKKRYELAAPFHDHHHHIFCEQCGKVVSIDSPTLEKVIKTIAETKGFTLQNHTLELHGVCRECQSIQ